jgi:non-heme chloroperoxidase
MKKFVTLSTGVRLEYAEHGDRNGTPVVLLHGVTDSWRSFERVLPLLPPSIHAFAVSQRGHGESTRPCAGYRLADLSDDLEAFLDAVGVERAVVVGHSLGASVAQQFAVDHQERVSELVLVGAFANMYRDPGLTDFFDAAIADLTDPVDPSFVRAWQLGTLARTMPADHLEIVIAETLKVPARVWKAAFTGMLETPDFSGRLRGVRVPTLVLWGDRDVYVERESQDRLIDLIPDARLAVYEGAGHALHWEDPLRFASDLIQFVAEGTALREHTRVERAIAAV